MSKLLTFLLAGAAFVTACYLVAFRKAVPNPAGTKGLHRGFLISVILFASLLITLGCKKKEEPVGPTCYRPAPPGTQTVEDRRKAVLKTLGEVWATLDKSREEEFNRLTNRAKEIGAFQEGVGEVLKSVFAELSDHLCRKKGDITCYIPSPQAENQELLRERVFLQLRKLAEARKEGKLDEKTVAKVIASLEMNFEQMHLARILTPVERREYLRRKGTVSSFEASDVAKKAVKLVREFETMSPPKDR